MKAGNIKTLHRKDGIIRFILNEEVCLEQVYVSREIRTSIIKYWEKYNKNKSYIIEIIPNWDIWNGKY